MKSFLERVRKRSPKSPPRARRLSKPDLIIGIDFGMTYTGVAWTNLTNDPQVVATWPSQIDGNESKVPTKLLYSSSANDATVVQWGFECDNSRAGTGLKERKLFKTNLDRDTAERHRKEGLDPHISVSEARKSTSDYFAKLYTHIEQLMKDQGQGWQDKAVEFVFTTPTTWTSQDTINEFRKAYEEAGFGRSNGKNHTVYRGLSEAEAVAVHTVVQGQVVCEKDDVILICDAGGGTTDLALVRVTEQTKSTATPTKTWPTVKAISQDQGVGIGSSMIDLYVQKLYKDRLSKHVDAPEWLPEANTLSNVREFQSIKHAFGTTAGKQTDYFIPLQGVPKTFTHEGLRIKDGDLILSRAELAEKFEQLAVAIIEMINTMLKRSQNDQVKFLVLSGGLGRSPYIFDRIKQEFKQNEHPQCSQMQIFQANTPQLAVVKGLVHDRRQWYLTDGCSSVFTHRIAPWSYGIHCRVRITKELYIRDEEKEKIVPDPYRPGEQFLTGRIEWIIKKGDEVSTECAWEERFTRTLAPGSTDRLFVDEFVVSDDDPKNLPRSMSSKGVHKLCELQSNLKIVAEKDFKEIGNRWWSRTKHHFEIRHSIRIVLGPNDTQFELLFNNKVFGRTATDSGLIHWDPVGKTKKPNVENTPELRDLK